MMVFLALKYFLKYIKYITGLPRIGLHFKYILKNVVSSPDNESLEELVDD